MQACTERMDNKELTIPLGTGLWLLASRSQKLLASRVLFMQGFLVTRMVRWAASLLHDPHAYARAPKNLRPPPSRHAASLSWQTS